MERINREVNALKSLYHPNVIKLYEVIGFFFYVSHLLLFTCMLFFCNVRYLCNSFFRHTEAHLYRHRIRSWWRALCLTFVVLILPYLHIRPINRNILFVTLAWKRGRRVDTSTCWSVGLNTATRCAIHNLVNLIFSYLFRLLHLLWS
jgi:hypothetical protein